MNGLLHRRPQLAPRAPLGPWASVGTVTAGRYRSLVKNVLQSLAVAMNLRRALVLTG
jgi:hypothetical protein